jgi:phosphate/sulfate permease
MASMLAFSHGANDAQKSVGVVAALLRELYRRCARIGELVIDVAERVVYAVVKQD